MQTTTMQCPNCGRQVNAATLAKHVEGASCATDQVLRSLRFAGWRERASFESIADLVADGIETRLGPVRGPRGYGGRRLVQAVYVPAAIEELLELTANFREARRALVAAYRSDPETLGALRALRSIDVELFNEECRRIAQDFQEATNG